MKQIALIGSPNCGKTTLFNRLTGARQRTGNWPGVTIERKEGQLKLAEEPAALIDLPGIYTLEGSQTSLDTQVAYQYLSEAQAELIIFVVDATCLARQLQLLPQLQRLGVPLIVAVNMIDSARRERIQLDLDLLATQTGLPVIGISAAKGEGVESLKKWVSVTLNAGCADWKPAAVEPIEDPLALAMEVCYQPLGRSVTDRIDRWVLSPWLSVPLFLLVMYLLFSISVNVGAVFIDFFDILLGSWVVDGSRWLLHSAGSPEWLTALLADGLGGGLQLIATFIPVIGCLYLCMSVLEDSGYLSRATFVIDGLMARIGLPGQAFIPLIVGFGCNVPSVMAARALDRPSARMTTIFIAPFMSCGARLSVYVFVGTALFPEQAHNAIFALYLLGILIAVLSAWLLRRSLFRQEDSGHINEMPAYHRPVLRNVLIQSWQRLYGFMFRAGKRIMVAVVLLTLASSMGTDGSWGNQGTEKSVLAATGKVLTPVFEPIGIGEQNWPATVGLFTGLFAKEVVVGTLDTLYNPISVTPSNTERYARPDFAAGLEDALASIGDNFTGLVDTLDNPLGIETGDLSDLDEAAQAQGVSSSSYDSMITLFPSAWAAFCFLVFILLYAPCVATIGVMQREAGTAWLQFSVIWSLLLSYWLASNLWQLSLLFAQPLYSLCWLMGSTSVLILSYRMICARVRRHYVNEIPAINIG